MLRIDITVVDSPWIAPLLYTPPTFEYFKSNRDPAMEAIIEYMGNKKGF